PSDALDALAQRIPVDEVRFFVMAVKLQRQTGGQLAEVLGNIAHLLRQRQQLVDRVRVLTAEGRLSAQVLSALPPVTAAALWLVRPEFIALLWTDPMGLQMLQASAVLMVLGCLWLWRMTRIHV
ncbi:MAG: type II secretion system F family protein, partial [Burkholderiales bacterium]|nr:type II secretion system F family protein [Burkholderiales bacterium]